MKHSARSQDWDKRKVVFLPIKPVFAERLIEGTKHFEFRRRPIQNDVTHLVVYASSPCQRIIGIVQVKHVESGSVRSIWDKTKEYAGISKSEYMNYFSGTTTAYAIAIDPSKTVRFDKHISPRDIQQNFVVPQSFKYVGSDFMQSLMGHA